jgi:putative transposase
MGLTAGLVPPRVDAQVKAGLLALVEHAVRVGGWSARRAAATLGLDHVRVLRWQTRAVLGRLDDAKPGPDTPVHALLDWERDAICKLAAEWGEVDRSHRKLAHRGSRLDLVHVSESTLLRVLVAAGVHLPVRPARAPRPARAWPAWADLVPGVIYIYDCTHFPASRWCAVAVATWSPAPGCPQWSVPRRPPPRSRSRSPARCSPTARTTSWRIRPCSPSSPAGWCPTATSCPCCSPCPTTARR